MRTPWLEPARRARSALAIVLVCACMVVGMAVTAATGQDAVEVRRLAGPNRYATAAALAGDAWTRSSAVVIADGGQVFDALVGAHLAARVDAPLLLSSARLTEVPPETAAAVEELQPTTVYRINLAATPPLSRDVDIRDVQGETDAHLAVAALAAEPGSSAAPVVMASDAVFADALSAAGLAPARLLLNGPDQLDAQAAAWLRQEQPEQVFVMGGPAAISDRVTAAVQALGPDVSRIAGPNRYATSVVGATVDTVPDVPAPVALASGQDWPDAVALVSWAARRDGSVLLTTHPELPVEIAAVIGPQADTVLPAERIVIAGGTVAVGNFVDEQVAALIQGTTAPDARTAISVLSAEDRTAMTGVSWQPGCPVGLDDLRVVRTRYWQFDGNVAPDGQLIVHRDVAPDVARVLDALFVARFPIARMEPVRNHGADDIASMDADNSSAFNCRTVAGTNRWSEHAFGRAVDINPIENPFVGRTVVLPEAGRAFLDRTHERPGMILRDGPVVAAFREIGWGWGADFTTSDDYQHFSQSGN